MNCVSFPANGSVSFLYMQINVNGSGYDEQKTYVVSFIVWNTRSLDLQNEQVM